MAAKVGGVQRQDVAQRHDGQRGDVRRRTGGSWRRHGFFARREGGHRRCGDREAVHEQRPRARQWHTSVKVCSEARGQLLVPVIVWLVSVMNLPSCTVGNVKWIGIFEEMSKIIAKSYS